MTCGSGGRFYQVKANGMVRDVFDAASVGGLKGWMGVGHGSSARVQIFSLSEGRFSAVSDCWQLGPRRGPAVLRQLAIRDNLRSCQCLACSTADIVKLMRSRMAISSTPLLSVNSLTPMLTDISIPIPTPSFSSTSWRTIYRRLANFGESPSFIEECDTEGPTSINEEDIFTAIGDLMKTCIGAYASIAMLAGFGLIVFRDPNGIRPVGLATRPGGRGGTDYLVASESVVAQGLGFRAWEDVKAGEDWSLSQLDVQLPVGCLYSPMCPSIGEAIIITRNKISRRQVATPRDFAPDIFEYVYFARPDSTLDGISVYRSRMAMGDLLAETAKKELKKAGMNVDVVIPVPDTSRVAALQLAQHLGIPYREGFVKNRYVGRTFIMPGQSQR